MKPGPYGIEPEASNAKRYALLLSGLFILILIFQWRFGYEPERARLEARRDETQRLLGKLENLEQHSSRAEERAELRRRVPEDLEIESFLEGFRAWVGSGGARVEDARYEVREHDLYEEVRFTVRLQGGPETIATLLRRREELPRLVQWEDVDEGSGELSFTLFAMPAPPSVVHRPACDESGRRVPTWPFTGWLEGRRAELRRLCAELDRRREDVQRLEVYESLAAEVEMLRRFIDTKKRS